MQNSSSSSSLSSAASGPINAQPLHILYGHEDVVTCVIINTELDVALSSSKVFSLNQLTVNLKIYKLVKLHNKIFDASQPFEFLCAKKVHLNKTWLHDYKIIKQYKIIQRFNKSKKKQF